MTPTCTAERDSVFSRYRFLIALEAADDQHHAAAVTLWNDIRNQRVSFVTTSYVFDEVLTFFNIRGHHAKAVSIGETLLASKLVTLVHVDEAMFAEAWRDFTDYADGPVMLLPGRRRLLTKPSATGSLAGHIKISIAAPGLSILSRRQLF